MFHLIFKQDFRNFRQMESAQQASHYLQGLSRCSVPFCHWTFRIRKLGFLFKWKAPYNLPTKIRYAHEHPHVCTKIQYAHEHPHICIPKSSIPMTMLMSILQDFGTHMSVLMRYQNKVCSYIACTLIRKKTVTLLSL